MTNERFYDRFEKVWHDLIGSPAQHTLRYANCAGMFKEADEEIERLNRKVEELENTLLRLADVRATAEPGAAQYPGDEQMASWLEEMHDYVRPESQPTLLRAAELIRAGDSIPTGGCGCRENGVPVMRAQCRLHGH